MRNSRILNMRRNATQKTKKIRITKVFYYSKIKAMFTCLFEGEISSSAELDYKIILNDISLLTMTTYI